MASRRKSIKKETRDIYMQELLEIVNPIFESDIKSMSRKKRNVEARMVFSKILREIGVTHVHIAEFILKEHCSIVHYMNNFENYFRDASLRRKYVECRDAFFEKRPADVLYLERDEIAEMKSKYARFQRILDIMHQRTPAGKEDILEKRITLFLNGI